MNPITVNEEKCIGCSLCVNVETVMKDEVHHGDAVKGLLK